MRRTPISWIICLILLVVYTWTLTGRAAVAMRVDAGRCVAEVYGRWSAIDCPGLTGGKLLTFRQSETGADKFRGPLTLLDRPSDWEMLELLGPDGQSLPLTSSLPATFELSGRLRRPQEPGGLVLLRPGEDAGWVFILNGGTRSGEWWQWVDGQPTAPLAGIAVDMPFAIQARTLVRQILNGWQGAVILVGMTWLFGRIGILVWRRRWGLRGIRLTMRFNRQAWRLLARPAVIVLCMVSFALALHVSVDVLERLPHVQDSLTYLFQAQTLAGGKLTAPAPPLTGPDETPHFRQEFLLVRDGRWFGKYPPGYPALLAIGVAAGGHWLVNPLLAALTVALLFALTHALYGRDHGRQTTGRRLPTADSESKAPEELNAKARRCEDAKADLLATDHYPLSTDPLNTDRLITDLPYTVYCLLPPLLLVTSPFFLAMSGSLMAHAAELFWTTLFMVAWAKARGRDGRRWAAVAGLALGALFLTRQFTAVTIGLSFGLGWLVVAHFRTTVHRRRSVDSRQWLVASTESSIQYPVNSMRQPVPTVPSQAGMLAPHDPPQAGQLASRSPLLPDSRRAHASPAPLLFLAALTFAPFALALFAYQTAVTGNPLTDPRLLYWPYDRVGFGPEFGEPENVYTFWQSNAGPAIQWTTDPAQPPRGHTPARGLYNLGRNMDALEEELFGWPAIFTLAFIWLAFLLRRPAAADVVLLLVILATAAGYVAFWTAGLAYGPRYFYAALPALAILTGRGVGALSAVSRRTTGVALWSVVILILLLTWNLLHLPAVVESYRGYNFISGEPRAAVESAVEPPALVFVAVSQADWWEYGAFFTGNTPWLDGDVVYARDLGTAENARLRAQFPERAAYLWRGGRLVSILTP
jgi:hypothetical protein